MKKKTVLIIIVVFLVCAFLGFKAAQKIFPSSGIHSIGQGENTSSILVTQNNYLIFHVNDRLLEKPELISIWAAFAYQTNPPQLMFVPLYPATNPEIHEKIANSFKLNPDGSVNTSFINQVNKAFDIKTIGYILTDDAATALSIQWMTGVATTLVSTPAVTDMDKSAIRTSECTSYQQFCQLLTSGSGNAYLSAVNWNSLLPDHFFTNLPFETLALLQDQLKFAVSPIQCEVFLTP